MTIPVPVTLPSTSAWAVADWLDRSYTSGPAGADGLATITLPTLPDNERWQLSHVVVACTSGTVTKVRLYLDGITGAGLRDGSSSGGFDVADWALGLWVPPGRTLIAQWAGCAAGAVATLNLQATILRRS